jgi:hypothetical protein
VTLPGWWSHLAEHSPELGTSYRRGDLVAALWSTGEVVLGSNEKPAAIDRHHQETVTFDPHGLRTTGKASAQIDPGAGIVGSPTSDELGKP